ncbi:MAG: hypothetical protein LBL37_02785, partial [Gracilibacteraceae bacterium]|nr:hypothetical protein [Gracilibacteraceae bacterium]
MKKLSSLLAAMLLAAVAAAYGLGYANASDFFIDFYMLLRGSLGGFAVALPILCAVLAAVVLVAGWRSGGQSQNHAWPEGDESGGAMPAAADDSDWLYQPLGETDQFSSYFAEKLLAGSETAEQKRKKKVYARLGENFSTYFGEGSPSLKPVSRTVRVHGFQRYFNDAEYLMSREKSGSVKKDRQPDAWGGVMSTYRRHEAEMRRLDNILPQAEQPPEDEPDPPTRTDPPVWRDTPPPLARIIDMRRTAPPETTSESRTPPSAAASQPAPVTSAAPAPARPEAEWDAGEDTLWDDGSDWENEAPAAGASAEISAEPSAEPAKPAWAPNAASYVPRQYSGTLRAVARRKWVLPSSALLDKPVIKDKQPDIVDPERLEKIFASYNVSVSVNNVTVGPVVTRYEVVPHFGTKIRKIESLADDVALALASSGGVRIEMIPGRGAMGVEVPNKTADTVYFQQIVQSARFTEKKSLLRVALGHDIASAPVVAELNQMPHLLVAGATGSGKSIFINCLINSILFSATPDEARLMLIDPKMVELSQYSGIPHLLAPVVTDAKKATAALRLLVREMELRYELFANRKVRDIGGYNASLAPNDARLPYIVVIIDEMADLMMTAANDIEELVCRLAQIARAASMHHRLSTQRPSVQVVTGRIKATLPSRFSVAGA